MARPTAQASLILKKLGKVIEGFDAAMAAKVDKLITTIKAKRSDSDDEEEKPARRKPGRPATNAKANTKTTKAKAVEEAPAKRRGRPPRVKETDEYDGLNLKKLRKMISKLGEDPDIVQGRARSDDARAEKLRTYLRDRVG